jgi:enoyl-CoA hydratase
MNRSAETIKTKKEEYSMTELIQTERRGAVALLTLNRPETLNALDRSILLALEEAIQQVAASEDVRALVLTGEGRAFAAGADIEQMSHLCPAEAESFSRLGHRVFGSLEELPIPTIAAVNGFALGGGCELALSCDWIYGSTKAKFGQPEVKLGLIPGFGGTSRMVRRVGVGWAKELILTGATLRVDEAQRIGLVNRVFEPDELIEKSIAVAESVCEVGPQAVRLAKRIMQEGQSADVRVAHHLEQSGFGLAFASDEHREGMGAFLEKRDPKF